MTPLKHPPPDQERAEQATVMTEIKELIADLRALEAKATPGPLEVEHYFNGETGDHIGSRLVIDGWEIASVTSKEDAALIGAARNALPQLLSALEALISRSAVMEEAIIEAVDHARPYVDESGIIEIPLHPFGGLSRVRNEIQSARSALSLKAGKE